jgi:hypothetical protein
LRLNIMLLKNRSKHGVCTELLVNYSGLLLLCLLILLVYLQAHQGQQWK